jgi:hypothetical protein
MTHIDAKAYRFYEKPSVTDYGSLVEMTASNGLSEAEDGLGKLLHTDGNSATL